MEIRQSPRGGRPSKGARRLFGTRLALELAEIVDREAEALGVSRSDYLAQHLALTHSSLADAASRASSSTSLHPLNGQRRDTAPVPIDEGDLKQVLGRFEASRARSGLSGPTFGAALGFSAVRTGAYASGDLDLPAHALLRAERISKGLRRAHKAGWLTALDVSSQVREAVQAGRTSHALDVCARGMRDLLECHTLDPRTLSAWQAIPASTGHQHWDLLVASLVSRAFTIHSRQAPNWAPRRCRALPRPRVIASDGLSQQEIRSRTPRWLSANRLFVSADALGVPADGPPHHSEGDARR